MSSTCQKRRASGVCIRCGGPRDDGYYQCSTCRALKHDTYKYTYDLRRKMGQCINCGEKDARTVAGLSLCTKCTGNRKRQILRRKERVAG